MRRDARLAPQSARSRLRDGVWPDHATGPAATVLADPNIRAAYPGE
jgi:hypothetical protein